MKKILSIILIANTLICYSQSKKEAKITNEYLNVAHHKFDKIDLQITKWENVDTLTYFIKGDFQYMSPKKWNNFISTVERITSLKIVETKKEAIPDILIYFGKKLDYFNYTNNERAKRIISNNSNWSSRKFNSKKQLTKASFCLDTTKIKDQTEGEHYIIKQFLKSLGLTGKSDDSYSLFYKSYMNNGSHFGKNEKRLLRIHYNEKIKAGLKLNETIIVLKDSIDLQKILKEKF